MAVGYHLHFIRFFHMYNLEDSIVEHINPHKVLGRTAPSTSPHIIAMPPLVNSASHQGHFSLFNGPRAFYSFQWTKKAGSAGRSETAQTASSPRTLAASSPPPPSARVTPPIQSYTNHARKRVRSRLGTHGKISQHNSKKHK